MGAFTNRAQFFQSYLLGYLFWTGLTLGFMAVLILQFLGGGTWGFFVRRLAETAIMLIPLMALLFVPLLFGVHDLYLWARPEEVAKEEVLRHKSGYLNVPFWVVRTVVYFGLWTLGAVFYNRWSRAEDLTGEAWIARRLRRFSGLAMVLFGGTVSLAAVDWVMSLEPHWYSTIFGLLFTVGHILGALALSILFVAVMAKYEPYSDKLRAQHCQDLGNWLFAFVMLWAYMTLSQFLIIWYGNLPEETRGYLHRMNGEWQWVGIALVLLQFFLPFFILLSSEVKRDIRLLSKVAALVFAVRWIDVYWSVAPVFHPQGMHLHWMDLAAPVGIGGLWIALFVRALARRPVLPLNDARLQEVLSHDGH